ncbi:MAG: hypothetical protein GVY20_11290 [Bacteroidetes bacterium]|jgi:hypothetical protein|nr:hypothetical protein [Bacteroidota bacterium]
MKKRRIIHVLSVLIIASTLFSCSESDIGTSSNSDSLAAENIEGVAVQKSHGDSPQKVFSEFQEMRKKVGTMSKAEIDSLSDEEILELGEPILKATENTIKFSRETLQLLQEPNSELIEKIQTITSEEHNTLSKEIKQILESDKNHTTRNLSAQNIRELLKGFSGGSASMMSDCESMFNVQNGDVLLAVGDNFSLANYVCPAGSDFIILPGTHTGQSVQNSKNGNTWSAYTSAIMDGQSNTAVAFDQGLNNNSISLFTIKNYNVYGIVSTSGTENVDIIHMTFENIAPNASSGPNSAPGQENSAIYFENTENLYVRYSYFEDVASSIRIRDSVGPLKILDNEALNTGRNFFQCGNCQGAGIRINGNSLDRTSSYGNTVLEDWINIFESEGTSSDWIQVNNNRARGHGGSMWGSFAILGDAGGKYQEAIGNIGVSPGQVGIGVAGGHHMRVIDNKMYSDEWAHSNVAFYSADFDPNDTCSNHSFPAAPDQNVANWTCGDPGDCTPVGVQNHAHSDGNCGITKLQIRTNVQIDTTMGPSVWNTW